MNTPSRYHLASYVRPVTMFGPERFDRYDLDAPYQRGHVWTVEKQRNLILSLIQGLPTGAIVLNIYQRDKREGQTVVIDGKQRITAITEWLAGRLHVPGEWFGLAADLVTFNDLDVVERRGWHTYTTMSYEVSLKTTAEEFELFNRINHGGVPHAPLAEPGRES